MMLLQMRNRTFFGIAVGVLAAGLLAFGRPGLTVRKIAELEFGRLTRSTVVSVAYDDPGAGLYLIEGKAGRRIRVSIQPHDLVNGTWSIPCTIDNGQCAYSTDGGNTWATFSTGPLVQDLVLPKPESGTGASAAYIRIGGTLTTGAEQHRGNYTGEIEMSAIYIKGSGDSDDDDDDEGGKSRWESDPLSPALGSSGGIDRDSKSAVRSRAPQSSNR